MDGPIRTDVNFVAGFDGAARLPAAARSFTHRFAVIQETYRPDSVDMYFDAPLWLSLVDFISGHSPGAEVRIGKSALDPEAYLGFWRAAVDPMPEDIEVRRRGELVLYLAVEFWTHVGGPAPYHDSYTYSLLSNEDLSGRLIAHLRDSDAAHLWMLAADVMAAKPEEKTVLGSLWKLIR
jgi:hypothetical protein